MAVEQHHEGISTQQLADILPIGVAILDHHDQTVFANQRFKELTQTKPGLHMPTTAFDRLSQSIHPEDYNEFAADYRKALSNTKTDILTQYRTAPAAAARDQTETWRALTLTPLKDAAALKQFNSRGNGGFICTLTDITPEKTAELSQRKIAQDAKERKQQQERFIDMISHEVRNPLSAILHCTEDIVEALVEERGGNSEEAISQAAETISLCVAHQKKIIDDVLLFSKLDAFMLTLTPREVQPKRHLANLLTMFRPELRQRKIEFEYKLDESYASCGIDWVMADIDRIGQVLINLVSNAIKFTAESENERRIRVSVSASRQRPPSYPPNVVFFKPSQASLALDASARPEWGTGPAAYIMIAVKDTGVGISDQHQKRLFERFNQATPRTDRIYGGFGLGLNISRRLCHMHGGEIGVSSKEGQGSTFGFFFTIRQQPPQKEASNDAAASTDVKTKDELAIGQISNQVQELGKVAPPDIDISRRPSTTRVEEVAPNAPSDERKQHTSRIVDKQPDFTQKANSGSDKRHRVLLVEDNIINQQIVSRKLKSSGFDVTEVGNGLEAVDAWRRDNTFDCILMDQEMPVMDGKSATKAIRALEKNTGKRIPIMGVTANVRPEQQAEMVEAGMNTILHKPYKMADLCAGIKQLV